MGNIFQKQNAGAVIRPAPREAPVARAAPKDVVVRLMPPHPLDPYTLPTGLYDDKTCKWNENPRVREQMRRLILERKLAPRVVGLESADEKGTVECPVCFLYYCAYAINTIACCNRHMCSECYLSIQTPEGKSECPFCQRAGFQASYSGDPSVLCDASAPSPHVKSSKVENNSKAVGRGSGVAMSPEQKAELTKAGIVFATVEDREAVKREIDAQDKVHARDQAKEELRRRSRGPSASSSTPARPASGSGAAPSSVASRTASASRPFARSEPDDADLFLSMLQSLTDATSAAHSRTAGISAASRADTVSPSPQLTARGVSLSISDDAAGDSGEDAFDDMLLRQAILESLRPQQQSEPSSSTSITGPAQSAVPPASVAVGSNSVPAPASSGPLDDDALLQLALTMSLQR